MNIPIFLRRGTGLGHGDWSSSPGPKKKMEIAWVFTSLLDRGTRYTASDIESSIRKIVKPQVLNDPAFSPDHIRIAMIEYGFVERDEQGRYYRVADDFVDCFGDFGCLLYPSVDPGAGKIACPICASEVPVGSGMQEHILKHHVSLPPLDEIIAKYFN